jgi:signal transduction histidine kinase
VVSDATKITMILRNLVANALKFTTTGEVAVRCTGSPEGGLVLRVTDTGPGIGAADRARLFDMFQQGDAGRRAGGSGLGLGLYLVKRVTELMGGTVALVCGEPGRTTFEVVLPSAARTPA